MSFTLYDYVLSGNCYKIRLFAALLGVEYNSVAVDFHPGLEHKSEAMLQLNPAGTLPILSTPDHLTLTETPAMLVWMAGQYDAAKQWFPVEHTHNLAAVVQWLAFSSRLTSTVGELRMHTMLNQVVEVEAATTGAVQALRELEAHLAEQQLRGSPWLVGEQATVADIACFVYVALSPDANIEHDAYPAIRHWLYALKSLPGFITMPGIHQLHELKQP